MKIEELRTKMPIKVMPVSQCQPGNFVWFDDAVYELKEYEGVTRQTWFDPFKSYVWRARVDGTKLAVVRLRAVLVNRLEVKSWPEFYGRLAGPDRSFN